MSPVTGYEKDFVPTENPQGASDEEQSYCDLELKLKWNFMLLITN